MSASMNIFIITLQSAITRLTTHFTLDLVLNWWFANVEKSIVLHDTECPNYNHVFLGNAKLKL